MKGRPYPTRESFKTLGHKEVTLRQSHTFQDGKRSLDRFIANVSTPNGSTTNSGRRTILWITVATMVLLAGATALFIRSQLDLGSPVAGVSAVAVQDNRFDPAAIQVSRGTTVTWRWEGEEEHNVVGDTMESAIQAEGSLSERFDESGVHSYECTLHLFMRGEVVVTN